MNWKLFGSLLAVFPKKEMKGHPELQREVLHSNGSCQSYDIHLLYNITKQKQHLSMHDHDKQFLKIE